jgi:DNA-binding beta-propeller fold protein YncE
MINLANMSKQEKIIIGTLFGILLIVILIMFNPDNVSKERKPVQQAQSSEAKKGSFNSARDLDVDTDGNIYVVDSRNHRIQKFNKENTFVSMWGKEGEDKGKFKEPCGIDMGPDGNLYVTDTWNSRIQVFNKSGKYIRDFGKDKGMWGPRDAAVDKNGYVYVCDTGNGKIEKFDPQGKPVATFGAKGAGKVQFNEPFGIKEGPDGNIYVLDRKNYRVQILTPNGQYVNEFKVDGWADGQIVNGCLMEPYLSIDRQRGFIYITDSTNKRVLRYSLDGKKKKIIDKNENGAPLFGCPLSVAYAGGGKIVVSDSGLNKLISYIDKD